MMTIVGRHVHIRERRFCFCHRGGLPSITTPPAPSSLLSRETESVASCRHRPHH